MNFTRRVVVASLLLLMILCPVNKAKAISFGDAALTVGISTVAGAALGASTLPFYGDSSKHTSNIFYGAAFGAVIGVFLSAYAGFSQGKEMAEDSARLENRFYSPAAKSAPIENSNSLHTSAALYGDTVVAWSPIAELRW